MPVPEQLTKLYYSIGEVAILKPKKNKKGNRMFTPKDIDNLQLIYHLLKERGYTIEGAKKKLRDNKEDTVRNSELVTKLQYVRAELEKIKSQLERWKKVL